MTDREREILRKLVRDTIIAVAIVGVIAAARWFV